MSSRTRKQCCRFRFSRDTREEMIHLMDYIVKEKSLTEERIINGMSILGTNVKLYNDMLTYAQEMKKVYFDLYFKVKAESKTKEALPITNNELRQFRIIDEFQKKDLAQEVKTIGETVLFTETLHNIKKRATADAKK